MENTNIIKFPEIKIKNEDFEVDFGIEFGFKESSKNRSDLRFDEFAEKIEDVNIALDINNNRLSELNSEIGRLTNSADGIDYMVAVGSGILAGMVDSFWVGKFDFERGKELSNEKVNEFVMNIAKKQGFNQDAYKGQNPMKGAIKHLEDKFHIPSDGIWNSDHYGMNGISHHLDDWAHHPSILGLFCSILTQFTQKGYFSNKFGENISIKAPISLVVTKNGKTETVMLIGNDIPTKLFCGVMNWFFHLVSDMAGSSKNPGTGMGIPGPIVTLLKEFSAIPGINKTALPKKIGEIFETHRFDLRSEMAVGLELGRQAIPVVINEAIVRAFYFIRHLVSEAKEKREISKIEWKNTIPFNNRTIVRMLTIATGTFTLVDLADAAVRGAIKSGGSTAVFAKEFLLHVNFVGIGRFAVAVGTDASMGIKREILRNDRIVIFSEQLHLMNAKVYYMQASSWNAAENTEKTINEAIDMMHHTTQIFIQTMEKNRISLIKIEEYCEDAEKHNEGLIDNISDILKWG